MSLVPTEFFMNMQTNELSCISNKKEKDISKYFINSLTISYKFQLCSPCLLNSSILKGSHPSLFFPPIKANLCCPDILVFVIFHQIVIDVSRSTFLGKTTHNVPESNNCQHLHCCSGNLQGLYFHAGIFFFLHFHRSCAHHHESCIFICSGVLQCPEDTFPADIPLLWLLSSIFLLFHSEPVEEEYSIFVS